MGEVYRAKDTRLNRDIAIKVLPALFANDAERLARFTREAQVLASLNHPNIAAIYGIEENALIMELVEGEDLSVHIARGPMALGDALGVAKQIADALEAAHDQGIVHRDLKPQNIKLRADGTVKVLDFGLAKALSPEGTSAPVDAMNSPTLTARATQMGMILGTAAYMAPEQAKGRAVDRRADIWAFGVVLYEMLTGKRAFVGDDITEVLASVLKTDPDWSMVPNDLPSSIRRLLRRCLEKDPKSRLSSIGDARLELNEKEPAAVTSDARAAAPSPSLVARVWPALAGVALAAGIAALLWPSGSASSGTVVRTSVIAPPGEQFYPDSSQVTISPDGTMVAFISGDIQQANGLWIRELGSLTARRVNDADGGQQPFWSADSKRVGFFTQGKLRTAPVDGGPTGTVADVQANGARGGTWNATDVIVFAKDPSGPLFRVSANGGTPVQVTTLAADGTQSGHRYPSFLPDGDHFLYVALPARSGKFDVFVGALSGGAPLALGAMESAPVYAEPGYLLFARQGALAAQPFDLRALKLTGEAVSLGDAPTLILDPVMSFTACQVTSVSRNGKLAYYSAPTTNTLASWVNASGKVTGSVKLPPGQYSGVRVSPDGSHAILVRSVSATESSLWNVDLERGGAVPLSTGAGRNDQPVWSADGKRVFFASDRDGAADLFVKTVADATPEQPFYRSKVMFKNPEDVSRDGEWLLFTSLDPANAQNMYLLPRNGQGPAVPYIQGPQRDFQGRTSPDGHWLTYTSDETGRFEIYLESFPKAGLKRQVSADGGLASVWSADGKSISYVSGDLRSMMRVDFTPGVAPKIGAPQRLFTLPDASFAGDFDSRTNRYLTLLPERVGAGSVTIVQNWITALDKKR